MRVRNATAGRAIRSFVSAFSERRAVLNGDVVTKPLPARPDQFIEIYLADRYGVSHDGGPHEASPDLVVVGPQSYRRTQLLMSGDIDVFTIRFQPGGFHALFGIDMSALVDEGVVASDIVGAASERLRDAVLGASDFAARVARAEQWVQDRTTNARPLDAVAHAAWLLSRAKGRLRIDMLARRAGLGERQFTRRFTTQVGLPPKLYARTIRFNAVLATKEARPDATWTDLVHAAGYADQAHFIRECHAFSGTTPARFFAEWSGP
ncbi:helix-turn-helix domain-containing protein [Sphingomonas sp. PB4P5]|uniref:helix-turn-helix domain-containing protein n=1 Tax=Parasphingomonas puruogangriensis TaxID=3096155 RepID=UPI002FC84F06